MSEFEDTERIRRAELYEELKDLAKLRSALNLKLRLFSERGFKMRKLVIDNLKDLIYLQIRALDEEYLLIGLDQESWKNEEHFLHDLEHRLIHERRLHSVDQKKAIKDVLTLEHQEGPLIEQLLSHVKDYLHLLSSELAQLNVENLMSFKVLLSEEHGHVQRIESLIAAETQEEEGFARDTVL
jgi:hypothetical protein